MLLEVRNNVNEFGIRQYNTKYSSRQYIEISDGVMGKELEGS